MTLKTYKPYTKSTRATALVDKGNIWKGSPFKSLTKGKVSSGGRNNLGRITSRAKGSGHKKRYRFIDFFRKKYDVKARVERIEYDPNRTSYIALLKYEDNSRNYIICPQNLKIGDDVISGKNKEIKIGNCMPLKDIPPGTQVHNVELVEGNGDSYAYTYNYSSAFWTNPEQDFFVGFGIVGTHTMKVLVTAQFPN